MDIPYVNIHTHRRRGTDIEVVSVLAGRGSREAAARAATANIEKADNATSPAGGKDLTGAGDLADTASVESELPEPPFSAGVHPWQVSEIGEAELAEALREVETAEACAIGEIGLDYAVTTETPESDRDRQKAIFAAQLHIAEVRRLPVVLHCVRAFEPTMEMLAEVNPAAVIFHGFTGSPEQAERAVRAGYYLSFGERSLASPKSVEALRGTPPDRILLETDDSPAPIDDIYARVAEILDMPVDELAKQLYKNYLHIF